MPVLVPNSTLARLLSIVHFLEAMLAEHREMYGNNGEEKTATFISYGLGDELNTVHFSRPNGLAARLTLDMDSGLYQLYLGRLAVHPPPLGRLSSEIEFTAANLTWQQPLIYHFPIEQPLQVAEVLDHWFGNNHEHYLYRENIADWGFAAARQPGYESIVLGEPDPISLHKLQMGQSNPYDGSPGRDTAELIVQGILADLTDRRGIRTELENVDLETRQEIVSSLAKIVRTGLKQGST